jgi:hypothetical protein
MSTIFGQSSPISFWHHFSKFGQPLRVNDFKVLDARWKAGQYGIHKLLTREGR